MTTHSASQDDLEFRIAFESGQVTPDAFNHLAHLRLAYVYLVEGGVDDAEQKMRQALQGFLAAHRVPADKFHETLTRAWVRAVRHFMNRCESASFATFIAHSRRLADSTAMLTHYSPERLYSAEARAACVEPDLAPIPS